MRKSRDIAVRVRNVARLDKRNIAPVVFRIIARACREFATFECCDICKSADIPILRDHPHLLDAVVELGERAGKVPVQREATTFVFLEALEFLDQVKLELGAEPGAELESDVFVGEGAAIPPGTRRQATRIGESNPFLRRQEKAVPASLVPNSLEFDGIKTRVVNLLPHAEEENGVFVFQPLFDQRAAAIKAFDHVGQ